jgi:hypothetical protein
MFCGELRVIARVVIYPLLSKNSVANLTLSRTTLDAWQMMDRIIQRR